MGLAATVLAIDAVFGLALIGLALGLRRLFEPVRGHNLAQCVVTGGELVATFLAVAAVLSGCVTGTDLVGDAMWAAIFGVTAIILVGLAGRFTTRLVLGARLAAEIARNNVAAGIAAAAHWLVAGVLVSSCLYGRDLATFGVSLAFFALALVTLHLFVVAFRALTVYGDREEILGENAAAALSYAGVTVALGLIIGHAAEGTFVGIEASLRAFGLSVLGSLILYPVRQIVVGAFLVGGGLVLRGGRLDEGIARERSVGLGVLEAAAYIASALAWIRLT